MAQLLFVIVIIAASIGFFRCDGGGFDTGSNNLPTEEQKLPSQWERTRTVPGQVEQAAREQVDQINEQNRKILQQY